MKRHNNTGESDDRDDEGDSCVLIGTPLLDLLDEDVKFSNKPKRVDEQIVTDEKGRQRFHGAFTGGFSAGYFNSVGTKEGWAPSSFKSTRSERASNDKKSSFRPEDFMDEEVSGNSNILTLITGKRVLISVDIIKSINFKPFQKVLLFHITSFKSTKSFFFGLKFIDSQIKIFY